MGPAERQRRELGGAEMIIKYYFLNDSMGGRHILVARDMDEAKSLGLIRSWKLKAYMS